jgi:hypothetical protein
MCIGALCLSVPFAEAITEKQCIKNYNQIPNIKAQKNLEFKKLQTISPRTEGIKIALKAKYGQIISVDLAYTRIKGALQSGSCLEALAYFTKWSSTPSGISPIDTLCADYLKNGR